VGVGVGAGVGTLGQPLKMSRGLCRTRGRGGAVVGGALSPGGRSRAGSRGGVSVRLTLRRGGEGLGGRVFSGSSREASWVMIVADLGVAAPYRSG